MTKDYAEKVLANPRFGDPECIAAVNRLAQEPEVQRLRGLLVGRQMVCCLCDGEGTNCELCDPEGLMTLPRDLVDSWELDILQDVYEEISDYRYNK